MADTIQPWPLVEKGAQGHPVRTLQHLLRARDHTVTVDGIVGPLTWSALIVTVKRGDRGDAVRGVQEEFRHRDATGDPSLVLQVDGIFGPKTDAAVRGFQEALSLDYPEVVVDGIVGSVTWRALVSGMLTL